MKTIQAVLILFFYCQISNAQNYDWVNMFGGDGFDFSNQVAIDSEGNVYNSGFYREGNFTISDTTLPYVDNMDSYFAKYSTTGELLWVVSLYGVGVFDRTEGIQVADNGDVYLLSTVQEELSIGDQVNITISDTNNIDILLMKFSSNGVLLWHKIFGGAGFDLAYNLMLGESEIILVGHFNNDLVFADDTLTASSQDMFIASLNLNGEANWAKSYGGSGLDRLYNVSRYANGDLAVCGYSMGDWQFGSTQLDSISGVTYHTFIGRVGSDGSPIWAAQSLNDFTTQAQSIDVDPSGNSYVSYYDNNYDKFQIVKYDGLGNLIWDYNSSNSIDTLTALATGLKFTNGQLYVTGYLSQGNTLFGTTYTEIENTDYLLAVVNPDGTLDTLIHDGSTGKIKGYGLSIDTSTGTAVISARSDGEIFLNNTNLGNAIDDIVLIQLNIEDVISSIGSYKKEQLDVKLYPNPSSDFIYIENKSTVKFNQVIIFDQQGKQILNTRYSDRISINTLEPGYYFLEMIGLRNSVSLKFIVK